jgi:hypothetical protein
MPLPESHISNALRRIDRTMGALKALRKDLIDGDILHAYSVAAEAAFKDFRDVYHYLTLAKMELVQNIKEKP